MEFIDYQVLNRVAYITLNRPEKRNALNEKVVKELTQYFGDSILNDEIKVVILKANGPVFSAGADLDYLQKLQTNTYEDNLADSAALKDLFYLIYSFPKITIAQVEGDAIAGGCGLASVCDFVFSVPEAKFGYTEVKIGFIPALVSCFLNRKIGDARCRELLLSGNLISASIAEKYNLINFQADKSTISDDVKVYAEKLATSVSGNSVTQTKQLLEFVWNTTLEDALEAAVIANSRARATYDCKKGIAAFLNKEKVTW